MEEKKEKVVKTADEEEPGMNKYGVQPSEMPKIGEYKGGIVKSEIRTFLRKPETPRMATPAPGNDCYGHIYGCKG